MTTYNNSYSDYYDILYGDKDYKGETDFVSEIFKKYSNKDKKLLSLGCGTCNYELLLAKKGYKITGIDISEKMLKLASEKIRRAGLESKINIFEKDIRKFKFKEKFDEAMAMFNIIGLQTKDGDLKKTFVNVGDSLKKGGIFVFDCWYLPAVLKDKPKDKVKIIKTGSGSISRLTKSILFPKENIIEINFDILETVNNKVVNKVKEVHRVRYWALSELEYFLNKAGFSIVKTCNFMDLHSEISDKNWNIFVVARKR